MGKSAWFGLFFIGLSSISFASTVVLKSGETTEGRIIGTSTGEIYFQSGTRILNFAYRDIREITDFSAEEIEKGYGEEVAQALEISSAPLAAAKEVASREFTQSQLKDKMRAFKEYILKNFSRKLKPDEKGVLQSLGEVLDMPAPPPQSAENGSLTDRVLASYAPYQSDLHEKILNLMMRYLNEWISEARDGGGSFAAEEQFLERALGRTRLAILRSVLPTLEVLRDNVRRHLANIAELRYAASKVGVVQ